jgi:hypothetical protein
VLQKVVTFLPPNMRMELEDFGFRGEA